MLSSRTTTSLVIESISDAPGRHVHVGHQRQPAATTAAGSAAAPARRAVVRPSIRPTRRSISRYSSTSGPPISNTRPAASGAPGRRPGSGPRRRPRSAGSGCCTHRGVIIAGRCSTSCRVISQEIPPCPTMMPGPQRRHRHPGAAEQPLDLAAAAQVRGQLVAVVAEPAEVDDPLAARRSAAAAANARAASASRRLEVRVVQRVHQVVGGRAARPAPRAARPRRDVAAHRRARPAVASRAAGSSPAPRGRPRPGRGRADVRRTRTRRRPRCACSHPVVIGAARRTRSRSTARRRRSARPEAQPWTGGGSITPKPATASRSSTWPGASRSAILAALSSSSSASRTA